MNTISLKENTFVKKTYAKKTYTPEEIKLLVTGYLLIPPKLYELLPKGTHIRYLKTDGSFRRGGFIKLYFIKDNLKFMLIESNVAGGKNNIIFPAAISDIGKLWAKIYDKNFLEVHGKKK